MASDTDEDEHVMEFELPLHGGPSVDLFRSHYYLAYKLELDMSDKLLMRIFKMLAALCDPMTQPAESKYVLSVKGLADAATAMGYQILLDMRLEDQNTQPDHENDDNGNEHDDNDNYGDGDRQRNDPTKPRIDRAQLMPLENVDCSMLRFTLSLKFFQILNALTVLLRADDDLLLRELDNRREFWDTTAELWLPKLNTDDDDQILKVVYYMCCTLIVSIFFIFRGTEMSTNIALNPYMDYFVRLWKAHTYIVRRALEIDRELEEEAWTNKGEYVDTPDNVKRALMGSSAIRVALSVVIEDHFGWSRPEENLVSDEVFCIIDLISSPILEFFDPLSRVTQNGGALYTKSEKLATAMLLLRMHTNYSPYPKRKCSHELAKLRTLPEGMSLDLTVETYEYDQFDADIKYVFGHYESEDESASETAGGEEDFPMALRKDKDDIEYDEKGRDWRDQVRGSNVELTEEFSKLLEEFTAHDPDEASEHFFTNVNQVEEGLGVFALLEIEYMPKFLQHVGQSLLNTIALAALKALQGDHEIIDSMHKFLVSPAKPELLQEALQLKPYLIQFRRLTTFELILASNPNTACAIMDELLMVNGLRRLMIWFICHSINVHMSLISYVYELAAGLRGNSADRKSPYKFSRQGALVLSPVERLMLLHEFFINASPWLVSEESGEQNGVPAQRAEKMVVCLCLLILQLINKEIIVLSTDHTDDFEDYSQDIQVLLFPWIGRVPEARQLFFYVKNISFGNEYRGILPQALDDIDLKLFSLDAPESDLDTRKQLVLPEEGELAIPVASGKTKQDSTEGPVNATASDYEAEDFEELHYNQELDFGLECPLESGSDLLLTVLHGYKGEYPKNFSRALHDELRSILLSFPHYPFNVLRFIKSTSFIVTSKASGEFKDEWWNSEKKGWVLVEKDPNGVEGQALEITESEFNDEFLNGEGQFQENSGNKKAKSKKKKKKKTKRR